MENKPDKPKTPDILYQYRPPEEWAFDNLSRCVLFFGSPAEFNDPYDCIPPRFGNFTDEDRKSLVELAQRNNNAPLATDMETISKEEGERITAGMSDSIRRKWNKMRAPFGITCFSKRHDNLLMWSHYAGRGRGFCLAFDTRTTRGFRGCLIREVQYEKDILHGAASVILKEENGTLDLLSRKAKDWAYEQEWRVFRTTRSKDKKERERGYTPELIKAIYLGTEATDETKVRIRTIIRYVYPRAELWQGRLSDTEYKVEFDRIR